METHIRKSGGSGNGRRKPADTAIRGGEKSAAKQPLRSGVLFHRTGTAGKDSIDTQMSDKTGMLLRERLLRMSHPAEVREIAYGVEEPAAAKRIAILVDIASGCSGILKSFLIFIGQYFRLACRNIRTARGNRRPPSWRYPVFYLSFPTSDHIIYSHFGYFHKIGALSFC